MKPTLSNLALLAAAGTLLGASAFAGDATAPVKTSKPAAQERSTDTQAPKPKPAASTQGALKDTKPDAAGKPRQLEVPVSVVKSAD